MLTPSDLHGVMAMMPAFATANAADVRAIDTVDVATLRAGVDRIIDDGVDVIATTGSFGEFHTLLEDEYRTIVQASVEAVRGRVPLFIGCTSLNDRDVIRRMRFIQDTGAQGVLLGVPFYFPQTPDNIVRFYSEIADMFPSLAIMIYHNPVLHRAAIPVPAFNRLLEKRNIVATKDSHRDTREFLRLMRVAKGRLSVFVHFAQYYPFRELGAAGMWSYDCWMGPWPILRLRDAVDAGDVAAGMEVLYDLMSTGIGGGKVPPLEWRETASKLAIQAAGYCQPGPLRPPFVEIPDDVRANAAKYAAFWKTMCDKYRPQVQAKQLAAA